MRCGRCSRNKIDELYNYGGVSVCKSCYDAVNPKVETFHRLGESELKRLNSERWKLEIRLKQIEVILRKHDYLVEQGHEKMDFINR